MRKAEIEVKLFAETLGSVLVSTTDEEKDALWIPKSICQVERKQPHKPLPDLAVISLPMWKAQKEGLI